MEQGLHLEMRSKKGQRQTGSQNMMISGIASID
jgi:hypothetical protein